MNTISVRAAITIAALYATTFPSVSETLYKGFLKYTKTQDCKFETGLNQAPSQYHVNLQGGNQNFTSLSLINEYNAYGLQKDGAIPLGGTTFTAVKGFGIGWGGFNFSGGLKIISRIPAALTATTATITLTGQIRSPMGDPGVGGKPCIVNFQSAYLRVVE